MVRAEARQRAVEKPKVVDRAKLIDEQVRFSVKTVTGCDADSKRLGIVFEVCRHGYYERGRVACVDQRLALNNEHGTGLSRFRSPSRIEVREPNLAAPHSGSDSIRENSALTRMLSDRTFFDAAAIRSARIRVSMFRF
jgi:hypothetical protein